MMIAENLNRIKIKLGKSTKLVAISKTKPIALLMECYDAGQKIFGENKVQELAEKYEALPKDIEWHMVGHLQTNKVKYIAPFVSLIHSVDSLKLLMEINKQAENCQRVIPCLLQIYIAQEETKFGLSEEEAIALINDDAFKKLKNISLAGVMGMATNTENVAQIRKEFKSLKQFSDKLKKECATSQHPFMEISMGMSSDYEIAIEEGSTLIRVGSLIFGGR
jgi:pyridoxal phosphate enzyme (YggS family)